MTEELSSHSWFSCANCGWQVRARTEPLELPPTCRCGCEMVWRGPAPSPEEMPNVHVAPPLPAIPEFPKSTPEARVLEVIPPYPCAEKTKLTDEGRAIADRLLASVFGE